MPELGDSSVPLLYDTHAHFFSDDAITRENEPHKVLANERMNLVTSGASSSSTPTQVHELPMQTVGGLLEFNAKPEAAEHHQSRSRWLAPNG